MIAASCNSNYAKCRKFLIQEMEVGELETNLLNEDENSYSQSIQEPENSVLKKILNRVAGKLQFFSFYTVLSL
jgi:hypothetical protein